jgi:diaminopimelate decarboxylase
MVLIDGLPLTDYAESHDTPFYLYSGRIIRERLRSLREAFPAWIPCYAVKANPNPEVVRCIANGGCGLEVSSIGELQLAIDAGAVHVGVVGPGKTLELLERSAHAGVVWLAAESKRDLETMLHLTASSSAKSDILLRVNMAGRVRGAKETMAGTASQFGIDEEAIPSLVREIGPDRVRGLHLYAGSQLLDVDDAASAALGLVQTAAELHSATGIVWHRLICGLGIGVPPYLTRETEAGGHSARRLRDEMLRDKPERITELEDSDCVLELDVGRFIVADAGLLLTAVIDVKESRGERFVIVDSGMRSFVRPMMPWGETHAISVVGRAGDEDHFQATVVGPACLPGDVLARNIPLPGVRPGDVLAVHSAGAYGYSMSPLAWGSFGLTGEYFLDA